MIPIENAIVSIIPYVLLLIGLALTVITDSYISKTHKITFLIVLSLVTTLLIQNVADSLLDQTPYMVARKIISIYGYSIRPAVIVLFYYFLENKKGILPAWCLVGLNAALSMTALFSPLTFSYTGYPYYIFVRGPLGYASQVIGGILLFGLLLQAILEYKDNKKEMIFPIVSILFISGGVLLDTLLPVQKISALSALTVAIVISCIFMYCWFHVRFVREHESDLMAQQRIKIMVSQIQPHFLFNTIATFRALCKSDPKKAAEVAEKFGHYLRQNLDSLDSENLIPLEKEIEHTKIYTDIEMVRFENVRVEYDIQDTAFSLPPLTVQPIVENAIRHGVRIKKEGVVSVSTELTDNGHTIVIRDNGIGFDINQIDHSDGKHIGLNNVRERIEKLCGGTLLIESRINEGTTVTMRIPKEAIKE